MQEDVHPLTHRQSLIREALDHPDEFKAIEESHYQTKRARRASGERTWAFSTGTIHSSTPKNRLPTAYAGLCELAASDPLDEAPEKRR